MVISKSSVVKNVIGYQQVINGYRGLLVVIS